MRWVKDLLSSRSASRVSRARGRWSLLGSSAEFTIHQFPSVVGRVLPLRSAEFPHTARVSPWAMKYRKRPASTEGTGLQG